MGLKNFEVVFDNLSGCYNAGQNVTGAVIISTENDLTFSDIYIKYTGKADVYWTESRSDGDSTVTDSYSDKEVYFKHQEFLGDFHGKQSNKLEPGTYKFVFNFSLPHSIPSSFKGKCGKVYYKVKTIIYRKWKPNYKCERDFLVNSVVDLNSNEAAMQPAQVAISKKLGILSSKPVTVKIWVNRAGHVPGETILFFAEVDSMSDKHFDGSKVKFIQEINYIAKTSVCRIPKVLFKSSHGSFKHRDSWDKCPILVPTVPPSDLPHCKIIKINYYIEFTLRTGFMHKDIRVKLPVIIGTVPLQPLGGHPTAGFSGTPSGGAWEQSYFHK